MHAHLLLLLSLHPPHVSTAFLPTQIFPHRNIIKCADVRDSRNKRHHLSKLRVFPSENDEGRGLASSAQHDEVQNKATTNRVNVGDFDPQKKIPMKREVIVGNPQQRVLKEKEMSVTSILKELAAIQQQGPQKYCILGTRHCSFLHQQIIELL